MWQEMLAENRKLRKDLEMKTNEIALLSRDLLEYKQLAEEHGNMITAQKKKTKELQELLMGLSLYTNAWEGQDFT